MTVPASEEATVEEKEPPAWIDSDDDQMAVSLATQSRLRKLRTFEGEDVITGKEYTKRLQEQFKRLYPVPEWAKPKKAGHRKKRRRMSDSGSSTDDVDSDNMSIDEDEISTQPLAKLLQSTEPLTAIITSSEARKKIRPEVIDIQRTKDVSGANPSAIESLTFHPTHPILLSSGPSSLLTLHHISPSAPTPNPVLTKLAIPHHSLRTSTIHPQGQHIYLGSRRRYFHIWDLGTGRVARVTRIYGHADEQRTCERFKLSPCGRYMALVGSARKGGGAVNILDARTGQWICQARVEGRGGVADLAWWRDGEGLVVIGKGGQAIEYSVGDQQVVARWQDEGAVGTTVVSMGGKIGGGSNNGLGGDRWIAVGSQSGIVNIYDRNQWSLANVPARPSPKKALQQLVTPTSHLEFSPDGQLLVVASRWKKDALRLVHLPSCTVYRNWPTSGTPFGRISSVAWGAEGGLLAVANEQGKIRLWEVRG